jgi:hypothetical protein
LDFVSEDDLLNKDIRDDVIVNNKKILEEQIKEKEEKLIEE